MTWSNTFSRSAGNARIAAKAARGKTLFNDNTKGNCVDCHGADGSGIDTFGSSNLTKKNLFLYGSDRALDPRVAGQGTAWIDAGLRGCAEAGGDQGGFDLRLLTCCSGSPQHAGSARTGR